MKDRPNPWEWQEKAVDDAWVIILRIALVIVIVTIGIVYIL